MAVKLSEEARKLISEIHPAFVATANKQGRPNVAPKGSFRVLDEEHVIFVEASRMYTLANLRENPQLSAIVVDPATRRGCRIWGRAEILESGKLFETIATESSSKGRTVKCVIKVAVEEVVIL
ncbi:MAG: pyridoxamine 5'-phosphate oxidase family protein [Dehalococcoidales bacterium]|nr:pyridoxamine 5'-phosphate oxidase family protein [Dehalococcoidales bacterium]